MEHPVDPIYLYDSSRRNAEYFAKKYPDVVKELSILWRAMGIFYPNKTIEQSYKK